MRHRSRDEVDDAGILNKQLALGDQALNGRGLSAVHVEIAHPVLDVDTGIGPVDPGEATFDDRLQQGWVEISEAMRGENEGSIFFSEVLKRGLDIGARGGM